MRPEPRATYRVQMRPGFGFDEAAAICDYLSDLGITHLYCSPYLQARSGSEHGYDVVDHSRVSSDLGGPDGHARMLDALKGAGLGHLLDMVPNHMTVVERANGWWWDVLKHGSESRYASYFDIDWDPPEERLRRRILIPILGDHYGRVLSSGDLKVVEEDGEWVVRYFQHVLPLDPATTRGLEPSSLDEDALHELLDEQHYRLSFWRAAGQELNYRRFFSINDLAALRMENPDCFDDVHRFVLSLVERGDLQGLRIDHIDGLRDPRGYLEQLRAWAPGAYVVVEKILELDEALRRSWPVEGTTGYDFLNQVMGLFVDPASEDELTETYRSFTGCRDDLARLKRDKKHLLMETELAADIERLTELFVEVCEHDRDHRDYTRVEMREAVRATVAAMNVYRTYVRPGEDPEPEDVARVEEAVAGAARAHDDVEPDLLRFLADVLLLRVDGRAATELALRFQQTSGPVMAKGVEDTVFYVYNRFAALNEVGGDPGTFGISAERFHSFMETAQRERPLGMLASSTHDTKRSEDVRARLVLLSSYAGEWRAAVTRWRAMNERHRTDDLPDRNAEYLLYQTLVGAWPLDAERALAYMSKATKEAKTHTSWILADERYDAALERFVSGALGDRGFTDDLEAFAGTLVRHGWVNSLAQTLIKLTAPGVPDIYQGCETWDLSLVDPDNRRPVDYELRRSLLAEARRMRPEDAWRDADSGVVKVLVTTRALALRARRPEAFGAAATYEALPVTGGDAWIAFKRTDEVAVVVPRFPSRAGSGTVDLGGGTWSDVFTNETVEGRLSLEGRVERFPVVLLERVA